MFNPFAEKNIFYAFALGMLVYAVYSIMDGQIYYKGSYIARDNNPLTFWILVLIYLCIPLGALAIIILNQFNRAS